MAQRFRTVATPGYQRDVRNVTKRNPALLSAIEHLLDILEQDPYNTSRRHGIKKLTSVKAGEGQWRIRFDTYRLRYDIQGNEVILYSFHHRKEAY